MKNLTKPKIYGLIIETREVTFLSVQYAYSLEEAFLLAKIEFEKQNPLAPAELLLGARIGLFIVKKEEELFVEPEIIFKKQEKKKKELKNKLEELEKTFNSFSLVSKNEEKLSVSETILPTEEIKKNYKNDLMKKIIENKDLGMFNKNKVLFTLNEKKYIKTRLEQK